MGRLRYGPVLFTEEKVTGLQMATFVKDVPSSRGQYGIRYGEMTADGVHRRQRPNSVEHGVLTAKIIIAHTLACRSALWA